MTLRQACGRTQHGYDEPRRRVKFIGILFPLMAS